MSVQAVQGWPGPAGEVLRLDPVAVGAVGELIATAVTAACGKSWKAVKRSPEGQAVKAAADRALTGAFRDACMSEATADDVWIFAVAGIWEKAFSPNVIRVLAGCLTGAGGEAEFRAVAVQALHASGCDVAELGRTFWVEQFLCVLPRLLFKELSDAALENDSAARDLVGHLLEQRADARAAGGDEATPREFSEDMIVLLRRLDSEARIGRLPAYLPRGADVCALARTVRARRGLRSSARDMAEAAGRAYRLPVERPDEGEPIRPWPEVAKEHERLVVLADPGLGKSWLIRTETHRLCQQALSLADAGRSVTEQSIPLPMRCDQLAGTDGPSLPEVVAQNLVAQGFLPARSGAGLRGLVENGQVVLLLDALDELTSDEEYGRLKELLRSWHTQLGDRMRCVVTSRIAGYRGPPLPDAIEVELQSFTPEDVAAAVAVWRLPASAAARVVARMKDPAVAGMARVPLLLALLCSLATELPEGQQLPATRAELYERVLRWFLTRAHRAEEHPAYPEVTAAEVDGLLEILAPVAFHFATLPAGWTDLMSPAQLHHAIRLAGPAFTERNEPASDLVRELSVSVGILVPAGNPAAGRHPDYLFLHRTFAEYLVAHHLAALPTADWLQVIDQHMWLDPDWTEIIPLLGAQLGQSDARQLTGHLLSQTSDPFRHAMFTALRVIAERPDLDHFLPPEDLQRIAEEILSMIGHSGTRDTAESALAAIPRLPRPIIDRLAGRLDSHNAWRMRLAAVDALAGRDTPEVTAKLLQMLDYRDGEQRYHAACALRTMDSPVVTTGLLARLKSPESDTQISAAHALELNSAPSVTDGLLGLLCDIDPPVRDMAVELIRRRHTPYITGKLLEMLGSTEWHVRMAAAQALTLRALSGRDAPEVAKRLLEAVEDQDTDVQAAAALALIHRTGRKSPARSFSCSATMTLMSGKRLPTL